jgi:hypothetical protein
MLGQEFVMVHAVTFFSREFDPEADMNEIVREENGAIELVCI